MVKSSPSRTRVATTSSVDAASIDIALLEQVAGGDVSSWHALWNAAMPLIARRIRRHPRMRQRFHNLDVADCDYVLDVCGMVFERLSSCEHRNIKQYLDGARSLPSSSFAAWLIRLTDFVVSEYLTQKYGASRVDPRARKDELGAAGHAGLHKRDVGSFAARLQDDDPALLRSTRLSSAITGHKLLEYARDTFPSSEFACLELYLLGHSYEEIAELKQLEQAEAAEQVIRKLKQRLRTELDDGRITRHQRENAIGDRAV